MEKLLDDEDQGHGGHAQQGVHRAGVVDHKLPGDGKEQHVGDRPGGVEHQHFDKFDAHHDGHGVGEEGVGAEAPPQHLGKGSLPQKEQLQQGDGQNEDGDHQLQNPGRLEQALDKV